MKALCALLFFSLLATITLGQPVNGKWIGKLTQVPGGYSQLYDLELTINKKRSITGESYAYMKNAVYARFGFWGSVDGDSIRLAENLALMTEAISPVNWVVCVKNINVAYRKIGNREYLQGSWNGVSKDDVSDVCYPGSVILARNKEDLQYFLDSVRAEIPKNDPIAETVTPAVPIDFTAKFLNTDARKVTELEVNHLDLEIRVRDYLNVDNDTVSIYVNRKPLVRNIWLAKKQRNITFRIEKDILNEVLIYAENLGKIPPNTSEMILIDGKKTHRLLIESDKQKTAAIYLKYKP